MKALIANTVGFLGSHLGCRPVASLENRAAKFLQRYRRHYKAD